jgi:hypothetical protein
MRNEPNLNWQETKGERRATNKNEKRTQFYPKLFSTFTSKRCKKARTFTQKDAKKRALFSTLSKLFTRFSTPLACLVYPIPPKQPILTRTK